MTEKLPFSLTLPSILPPSQFISDVNRHQGMLAKDLPLVSIIIPTFNCAQSIYSTVDSVLKQDYPFIEVIIIDAGSSDRTVEIIKSFHNDKVFLYTVFNFQRYEMLNKGLSQAQGQYICFLFPGDCYLSSSTLRSLMDYVINYRFPHLIYGGILIREGYSEVRTLLREFRIGHLQRGLQPTGLQGCCFRHDIFSLVGKFDDTYSLRGGFEFLCRVIKQKIIRSVHIKRVWVDTQLYILTTETVLTHFLETGRAIWNHFSKKMFFLWLASQKDIKRLIKIGKKRIKLAFLNR